MYRQVREGQKWMERARKVEAELAVEVFDFV